MKEADNCFLHWVDKMYSRYLSQGLEHRQCSILVLNFQNVRNCYFNYFFQNLACQWHEPKAFEQGEINLSEFQILFIFIQICFSLRNNEMHNNTSARSCSYWESFFFKKKGTEGYLFSFVPSSQPVCWFRWKILLRGRWGEEEKNRASLIWRPVVLRGIFWWKFELWPWPLVIWNFRDMA